LGYRVAVYESAETFLATADLETPGCILLDMRMPGLTGLQLQQRMVGRLHTLPIVFISGHGDIPTSVLAMKSGAKNFLTKPVDTEVLLKAIEEAIVHGSKDRDRREQLDALRLRVASLTPTERKVFAMVVRGNLNKRIAAELGVDWVFWRRDYIDAKNELDRMEREARGEEL
jgi:FixJ family two-component response regulator